MDLNLVEKATKRLLILRRLTNLGAYEADLLDVFIKQIRSVLELAVPVCNGSITLAEQIDLESIQTISPSVCLTSLNKYAIAHSISLILKKGKVKHGDSSFV